MKVEWTDYAKGQKQPIANYIRRRFGVRHVADFNKDVRQSVQMIIRHPNIGIIDPNFPDCPKAYRSIIINGLSKMVYFIDDNKDTIYIVALWDTRREPKKQAQQVKENLWILNNKYSTN